MIGIHLENAGKKYRTYKSEFHRFAQWFGFRVKAVKESWVLRNISFDLRPKESLGIIGQNGAGKSTLLKILAGIVKPSEGTVVVGGRVSALLELGMGFDSELTGFQNVQNAGSLMGFCSNEIQRMMPSIEEFADVGEYFNQPLRCYSSGMQVRVAFAVATAWRPDVLIVDEALSVGDIKFQQKCFQKIREFKDQGTCLLFVTHDLTSLANVCDRALCLHMGQQIFQGGVKETIEHYFSLVGEENKRVKNEHAGLMSIAENYSNLPQVGCHYLSKVEFFDKTGQLTEALVQGESCRLRLTLNNLSCFSNPHVGFRIQDRRGIIIYETNTYCVNPLYTISREKNSQLTQVIFELEGNMIWGEYTIAVGIEDGPMDGGSFQKVVMATRIYKSFHVIKKSQQNQWSGIVDLKAKIIS